MRHLPQLCVLFLLAGRLAAQDLVINEFLASNNSVNTDEFGDHDDWVELWNPTGEAIDLGGLWASDGGTPWQIPTGQPELTTLPAGSFLLLWFDEEPDQGPLHIDDKLSAGGESIVLFAQDGSSELARHDFGTQTSNISEGRQGDGDALWTTFTTPTPAASNGQSALAAGGSRPARMELSASPNPFNPRTRVEIQLPTAARVQLRIHDLAGRTVRQEDLGFQAAGSVDWDWSPGRALPSGLYLLQVQAGPLSQTLRLLYIK